MTGERRARAAWALLWVGSVALLLQRANLAGGALRGVLAAAGSGQPGWYPSLLSGTARAIGDHGTGFIVAIAAEMVLMGAGVAAGWKLQSLLGVVTALAAMVWVFGEGFGGILTGAGTDPNTGPLLVLVLVVAGLTLHRPQGAATTRTAPEAAFTPRPVGEPV